MPASHLRLTRSLGATISALGLWPFLLAPRFHDVLAEAVDRVAVPKGLELNTRDKATLLFLGGPRCVDDVDAVHSFLYDHPRRIHAFHEVGAHQWRSEAFDLMSELPIPAEFASVAAVGRGSESSLMQWISIVAGTPIQALRNVQRPELALGILLFAACCLASREVNADHVTWRQAWHLGPEIELRPTPRQFGALREVALSGWEWLRMQLPAAVFDPSLEATIFTARNLRYGNPPDTNSTPSPTPGSPTPSGPAWSYNAGEQGAPQWQAIQARAL